MKKVLLLTLSSLCIFTASNYYLIAETKSKPVIKKIIPKLKELHKFKIKAAIIRSNGDIIPGAKIHINFWGYDRHALQKKYLEINNPTQEKPTPKDSKYKIDCGAIVPGHCGEDFDSYDKDFKEWEKIAYKGMDEEIKEIDKTHKYYSVDTNLSGEATMKLPKGLWYIFASWENSTSHVYWFYTPLDVTEDLDLFEISNDNATNIINKDD